MTPLIEQLIEAFRCLPGVGPKTAQRMVFHLLERDREGGARLSGLLSEGLCQIGRCRRCRTFTENELCSICTRDDRHNSQLCIVESPTDILSIEQTASFKGIYFVLMGCLSPLDGIGPDAIGIDYLNERLVNEPIDEVILATSTTVEGEATAHYIADMAKSYQVKTTRIAHGVPLGGELEYVDSVTLAQALSGRTIMS